MTWWMWLVSWLVLSAAAAFWIGAAAAIARRREHPDRDRAYGDRTGTGTEAGSAQRRSRGTLAR